MKRSFVLFAFLFSIFLVSQATFSSAALKECTEGDNGCKIDNGYSCLNGKIADKTCASLSSEEKVFSFLATGKCSSEVKSDSKYENEVIYTSQAILGGSSATSAKEWLLDRSKVSEGVDWFLEIESPEATACTVDYSNSNEVSINADKKIDSVTGGSCLTKSSNGYWVGVSSDCFGEEFTISCDKQFLTTLLYKGSNSDTIYVSEKTSSASADGTTKERVDSLCFSSGSGGCDYESTLWGALAADSLKENSSSYVPYLTTLAEDNEDLIPETFLYQLTGNVEFKNKLLGNQINSQWWVTKDDKYFGTALALLSLQYEEPAQKKDSVNWLLNTAQEEDGCWNSGNIRDSAFILYSISPNAISSSGTSCTGAGYFCTSQIGCSGDVLQGYGCSGAFVCCTQEPSLGTCVEQGGAICNSNQNCVGAGSIGVDSSDLASGEVCCLSGTCQEPQTPKLSECESLGGFCRTGCLAGEENNFKSCDFSSDSCCVPSTAPSKSYGWIWFFLALIALVIVGIVYRDRLRPYWFMIKSKFRGDKGPSGSGPVTSGPRSPPSMPPSLRRMVQGRGPSYGGRIPRVRSQGEIDEVLKKLKEMSK